MFSSPIPFLIAKAADICALSGGAVHPLLSEGEYLRHSGLEQLHLMERRVHRLVPQIVSSTLVVGQRRASRHHRGYCRVFSHQH